MNAEILNYGYDEEMALTCDPIELYDEQMVSWLTSFIN